MPIAGTLFLRIRGNEVVYWGKEGRDAEKTYVKPVERFIPASNAETIHMSVLIPKLYMLSLRERKGRHILKTASNAI